ncbi:MAG: hypothetical protein LBN06_02425 [Prevotellaceae bacterium]|jgi:hypothetical protein|nr:hypothetical protein [Prevotellaceae bacterium]
MTADKNNLRADRICEPYNYIPEIIQGYTYEEINKRLFDLNFGLFPLFDSSDLIGLINRKEKLVLPCLYDDIIKIAPTEVIVRRGDNVFHIQRPQDEDEALDDLHLHTWGDLQAYRREIVWTDKILEHYQDRIDWRLLSLHRYLVHDDDTLYPFRDRFDWNLINAPYDDDCYLQEFLDEISEPVIDALYKARYNTAKEVMRSSVYTLMNQTGLSKETLEAVLTLFEDEFLKSDDPD